MTGLGPWATRVLESSLPQPDRRSCGAASLVVARAVRDEHYAEFLATGAHPTTGWQIPGSLLDRFTFETLGMHTRVTGLADLVGRPQLPWPRALGTPPWAVARQLSTRTVHYVVRQALLGREQTYAAVVTSVAAGHPVPIFLGSRWLPRHVVLAVRADESTLWCYEPAAGRVVQAASDRFAAGRLAGLGWPHPWFIVRPR